jgi:hypothetical protein
VRGGGRGPGCHRLCSVEQLEIDSRVVIESTGRTVRIGTAGWRGRIIGKRIDVPTRDPDDPEWHLRDDALLDYVVELDEDDGRAWLVQPGELRPE